jgi:hypothetical protein
MYFPGLDIVLSILYIILLREEGKYSIHLLQSKRKQGLIAFLWQLPGFFMGISVIFGLDRLTDFAYYFVFMLELWLTPILPLISLLPVWTIAERPVYYYFLFIVVPLLAGFYYLPACNLKKKKVNPLAN